MGKMQTLKQQTNYDIVVDGVSVTVLYTALI